MAGAPGNIRYTIYPTTAIFTASYSASGGSFTFTNSDCTIVDDHLSYTSPTVNIIGTTTINAYNHEYTYETYDGAANVTVNLPTQNLYAWTNNLTDTDPITFYTTTANPTTSSKLYDANGNEININTIHSNSWGYGYIDDSSSSSSINIRFTAKV